MVEIVNIVATGYLGREYNLYELANNIDLPQIQYEPERFPGLQLRTEPEGGVMTIFTTGNYTVTGVSTESEMESIFSDILAAIEDLEIDTGNPESPEISNLVCTGDLERELSLPALSIALGTDQTEYEPEVSPFLYYRPENIDCLITIPTNGQAVITGVEQIEEAQRAFDQLYEKIEELFSEESGTSE